MQGQARFAPFLVLLASPLGAAQQSDDPAVSTWRRNLDGTTGTSEDPTIHAVVSTVLADVERVHFDVGSAYVEASGVPSHRVGPWPGNPGMADDQDIVYRVPRVPSEELGPKTFTSLGAIGALLNGVAIFNALDARSYNNQGIWNQNAIHFEGGGLDESFGHPARDQYHYHQHPVLFEWQQGQNGVDHSPMLGFAWDGFPIYGSHGYLNADGTGGVVRIESSYRLRDMTTRQTLPDGTLLAANQWGPAVSAMFPLGAYVEDFEYVAGGGMLDEHNGRFCVTPEYPGGTYAYFATLDANGEGAYPYFIGPTYYGVVDTGNIGMGSNITVPAGATEYAPFGIYSHDLEVGSIGTVAFGSASPGASLWLLYSPQGFGPSASAWGALWLEAPIKVATRRVADGSGEASVSFAVDSSMAGLTVYSQGVSIDGSGVTLSNPDRVFIP